MIIANIVGGLGNQMFQYACARSLSVDLGCTLKASTDTFGGYTFHNGFELERIFDLKIEVASKADLSQVLGRWQSIPLVRRVLCKKPFSIFAGQRFVAEPHYRYWPALSQRVQNNCYLQGYWQSELYFTKHNELINNDFTFHGELGFESLRTAQSIRNNTAISVHIRRGDYVNNKKTLATHGACSLEYYHTAIKTLLQKYPDAQLFAFSDDPEYVTQVLKPSYPGMIVVCHNSGLASFEDMKLMSMCNHHILANSSFSWWGAWLNRTPTKKVIAPKQWFANGTDTVDLIPASWERM